MLHTILIQKKIISEEEFSNIFDNIKIFKDIFDIDIKGFLKDANASNKKQTIYKCFDLNVLGLNEIVLKKVDVSNKYKYENKYIEIIVNPTKLLNKKNSIEITKTEDIDEFIVKLDAVLQLLSPGINSCIFWSVKRIDYARNVRVEQELIPKYLDLFSRADNGNLKVQYNYIGKRKKQMKGSFRLFNKSITINFYNKYDERINKNKSSEVEDAENVLRLEIQCKKNKVNNIKNKNKWDTNMLLNYLSEEISKETLYKYYKKTIGTEDYYSLKKAEEIINKSNMRENKKNKLIQILKLINKKRSVPGARELYCNDSQFNYYVGELKKLGINPVTLPRAWNIEHLKNVWYLEDL